MDPREILPALGVLVSIVVAIFGVLRTRRDIEVAVAVKDAIQEQKIVSLEKRIGELEAELDGVRAGLESGLARVHDGLGDVVKTLQELKTTVAVLVDRDERAPRQVRAPRGARKVPA